MNIRRVVVVGCVIFVGIVALAVCVSARFSLSNITSDPYAFISGFFDQWSVALSAAGTIILAISVFAYIYENRRGEEQERQRVIHALHNEMHWNRTPIEVLRLEFGIQSSYSTESESTSTQTKGPYRRIETRVFDDMRSRGQLHWLEELRVDIATCYALIDYYNSDGCFKPHHVTMLNTLQTRLDNLNRALETRFSFLPIYKIDEGVEDATGKVTTETSHLNRQDNQEPMSFKALPWGVLFFSFWTTLRTVDSQTLLMKGVAWFVLALSGILLLSVLARPLSPVFRRTLAKHVAGLGRVVTSRNVTWFFIVLVFFTTLIGVPANTVMSWSELQGVDFAISVAGLGCWLIAYLLVLVSISSRLGKVGQILGGIVSAGIVGMGIRTLGLSTLVGSVLIGIGAISIAIVITKPKHWDLLEMV